MDTDCNALYRYSIRHRVAKWKERGEEEGKGQRERDPDRESQTNLISCPSSPLPPVLVICTDQFETYGRKAPSPNYPSILDLYTRAINPVEKHREEASPRRYPVRPSIDREGEGGRNSMLELARLADQTFQRRSNILQRLLEPIGRSWLDLGQLSPYPVCRRVSLDGGETEI